MPRTEADWEAATTESAAGKGGGDFSVAIPLASGIAINDALQDGQLTSRPSFFEGTDSLARHSGQHIVTGMEPPKAKWSLPCLGDPNKKGASKPRPLHRAPPRAEQNSTRPDAPWAGSVGQALLLFLSRSARFGGFLWKQRLDAYASFKLSVWPLSGPIDSLVSFLSFSLPRNTAAVQI